MAILRRLSPWRIEPAMGSRVVADLGLDSIRVLELVAEIEERFDVAVPLNELPRIGTVADMVEKVEALVRAGAPQIP